MTNLRAVRMQTRVNSGVRRARDAREPAGPLDVADVARLTVLKQLDYEVVTARVLDTQGR
ncbi:hypothetical protein ACOCG7_04470 [Paraburkholderia sp. DD10]|uniref:hypothetical protein n=1 Tax=Paraburkholderia TaxID=1822464 RepID=UPI000DEFFA31|nr:hypothetical protein [Paraburkholderia terricola]AXE94559.1 hypothetical protein CUJ90_19170 [Paraburkholderia terricola]